VDLIFIGCLVAARHSSPNEIFMKCQRVLGRRCCQPNDKSDVYAIKLFAVCFLFFISSFETKFNLASSKKFLFLLLLVLRALPSSFGTRLGCFAFECRIKIVFNEAALRFVSGESSGMEIDGRLIIFLVIKRSSKCPRIKAKQGATLIAISCSLIPFGQLRLRPERGRRESR
jgi:hypothetical protein